MSKYLKISTIEAVPLAVDVDTELQEIVNLMKDYWQAKLSQVLQDKPDIIVLPELCDWPENFPPDRLKGYYNIRKEQILDFFAEKAQENQCYIVYPTAKQLEDETWRNSCNILDRQGLIAGVYNKNHVVISETTEHDILCGREVPIIDCDFGK